MALIASAIWGLLAAVTGAWAPLGPLDLQVGWWWGLPLFSGAVLVIFAAGALLAAHVAVLLNRGAAHTEERAASPVTGVGASPPAPSRKPRPAVVGRHG
jgi:hypothetical protein